MRNNFKDTNHLFSDLFRLGDYSKWIKPKNIYNLEWFNNKNTCDFQNEDLLIARTQDLLSQGLDLSDKAYLVANVNRPTILDFALKNGANLNHPKSNDLLLRAISRKRTKIVDVVLSSSQFTLTPSVISYLGANSKYKQLSLLLKDNPDIFFGEEQNKFMGLFSPTILNRKDGKTFLKELLSLSIEKEQYYSIHYLYKNTSILNSNKELAKIIIDTNNILFSDLEKKSNLKSKFKL